MPRKKTILPDTVTFRPDSRDARKDFQILKTTARDLFEKGVIAQDLTNGGYCPVQGQISQTQPWSFRRTHEADRSRRSKDLRPALPLL